MLSRVKELLRNNQYWLKTVMLSSHEYPQRLQWANNILEDLNSVKVEEINQLARNYLAPDKAVEVLVLPKKAAVPKTEPKKIQKNTRRGPK